MFHIIVSVVTQKSAQQTNLEKKQVDIVTSRPPSCPENFGLSEKGANREYRQVTTSQQAKRLKTNNTGVAKPLSHPESSKSFNKGSNDERNKMSQGDRNANTSTIVCRNKSPLLFDDREPSDVEYNDEYNSDDYNNDEYNNDESNNDEHNNDEYNSDDYNNDESTNEEHNNDEIPTSQVNTPCKKTKDETISQLNNGNIQESNSSPLLEFASDTEIASDANESLYKNTDENKSPSMLDCRRYLRKRSRLAFHSVKNNANATVAKNSDTTLVNNTTETDEDEVIEASPMQRSVASKVKQCLKLKRKIPVKRLDFSLYPSPTHISTQMENVNTLKDKVNINYLSPIKVHKKTDIQIKKFIKVQNEDQPLTNKINNFNLDDTENKPQEKKTILEKFNVRSKRKDVSKQLNMRCKADRAKLKGSDCWECREYYQTLKLSKEKLQKRKNQCSRHRDRFERPKTPEEQDNQSSGFKETWQDVPVINFVSPLRAQQALQQKNDDISHIKRCLQQLLQMQAASNLTLKDIKQRQIKLENVIKSITPIGLKPLDSDDSLIVELLPLATINNMKEFDSLLKTSNEAVTQFVLLCPKSKVTLHLFRKFFIYSCKSISSPSK
ncbi:protein PFC0760c-like isoform X2 [Solenopsis invicta]|uniref:protein PFC0760c-like isoform X2 n=1 Tax=Solenopsis invicta TaxID=13686 RepID=UPI00193E80AA|nr:protein PFC0760c-like isoform X2 [Solenopsis invicta]XP_039306827.1 protein PFC0760c-like isoform X2 [Solenopsis invicta]